MKLFVMLVFAGGAFAAGPLTLKDAVRAALEQHPSIEAGRSGVKAAESRVSQARAEYLPKLNYAESVLRSNNPVVVFSSLLSQHRFTAANFELGPLNRPDFLNSFQSQVTLDQTIYDGGRTRWAVKSAELGRSMTAEDERGNRMNVIANVARAYHGAVLAAEGVRVAGEAVRSAEADLARAENVRAAGMSTDADVLSIRVHLAGVREEQIRRQADLDVALAALNETLGLPLSEPHELTTPLRVAPFDERALEAYEKESVESRPEMREARLAASLADTQGAAARSALRPRIVAHGGFEADRQTFATRGGASWLASASFEWNLFNGGADKARISEAAYGLQRARALESQANARVRLEVRRAYAELGSAARRIEVAQAAVSMAEESLRITKNRFEAGLANVTDLLRTETALLSAHNRWLGAVYDQRVAAVNLALAAGTLTENSEVLN
ncbi:MAG: TolC family protein [Acidobacteriota bacterium]